MNNIRQKSLTLWLLALIFIGPGVAALFFYSHPQWLTQSTVNKGVLVNPPLLFAHFKDNKKWRLLLVNDGECASACLQLMDKLARIRLALGRHLYQVDSYLILKNNTIALPETIKTIFNKNQITVINEHGNTINSALTDHKSAIFIANPQQYLVLSYDNDANSDDIFHDLQQLINTGSKSV